MVGTRSFPFGARPIFKGLLCSVSFRECHVDGNRPRLSTMQLATLKRTTSSGMDASLLYLLCCFFHVDKFGVSGTRNTFFFSNVRALRLWKPVVFSWSPDGPHPKTNSQQTHLNIGRLRPNNLKLSLSSKSIVRFRWDFISFREGSYKLGGFNYDEQPPW